MNNTREFTCYFCNKIIKDETEVGHTTLCSKTLVPCVYKCGIYIERAKMPKHKMQCVNNTNGLNKTAQRHSSSSITLERNGADLSQLKYHEDIAKLQRRCAELETRLASRQVQTLERDSPKPNLAELKNSLNQHSLALQKCSYFQGIIAEWKKNIESQIAQIKLTLASKGGISNDLEKQLKPIQERLLQVDHFKMDLNILKESVYKENTHFKKSEMDFARSIEELNSIVNELHLSMNNAWREHANVVKNTIVEVENTKAALDEQKAKTASLVFDMRAINQVSFEAAEKIEIQEREQATLRQEVNQMKIDLEILDDLAGSSGGDYNCFKRLLWRITDVDSKLIRAKENDIVLKSPIFYTHKYGYKVRVFLYLNGLNKWRDRYTLACLHVLKGEYDLLLDWPCTIEGSIALPNLHKGKQSKRFSKYFKTKRSTGDEDDDEPQESNPTYIFIPHNVLFKDGYVKDDTIFLDININDLVVRETAI